MDLCLILLVIVGYCFMWDWANGNEDTDSLASAVAIIDTVVLTLYIGVVVIPHYTSRIHDVDVGKFLKTLGFYIPILIIIVFLAIHGDLMDDPQQSKVWMAFYMIIALCILSTLRFIYVHYYLKNKEKKEVLE